MQNFTYKKGAMHAEDVFIGEMVQKIGTPLYCYSTDAIKQHYHNFVQAFAPYEPLVCYSVKASSNLSIIRSLAKMGSGADVVSQGELKRALLAGVPADKIVFSGVGKTKEEMAYALSSKIFAFNVESEAELVALSEVASSRDQQAHIAFRINPDVDARTHAKISTGKSEHKFGVSWQDAPRLYDLARNLPGIKVQGVPMHIGSQIRQVEPFGDAFGLLAELIADLRQAGHEIAFVNLGGGLGIAYHSEDLPQQIATLRDYANLVKSFAPKFKARLLFEPGRIIIGNAGALITKVIYVKYNGAKRFIIVDAGMNDLIRPTLYDAYHEIRPVKLDERIVNEKLREAPEGVGPVDVVGPVCETGDFFARDRVMGEIKAGDLLAIMSTGAYGAVQASTYNSRLLIPEVLVHGHDYAIIRQRPNYEDMLKGEAIAPWLEDL